ncbi:uncharacterized protein LOC135955586 [Calliphora vicina]|uniref:uncharacterized protein LOC135955586 n=1 Tax=Calliphora vicina TaxID=7373 RepID=UPI00325B6DA2
MALKIVQINLQHSKCATDNLRVLLAEEDLDIGLMQEPWASDLDLSSEDLTVAKVELPCNRSFMIASSYMANEKTAPPVEVSALLSSVGASDDIILGCDANARHSIWGNSEINERGESLLNFINSNKLSICNSGNTPTFMFPSSDNYNGWEEVLDITLINDRSKNMPVVENSITGLEKIEENFSKTLVKAFEVSCPVTKAKKSFPPWWNSDLSKLRRETRRAFNISYNSKSWQPYRDQLKAYKKAIVVAKRNSWRSFCESIDNTKDSARLSRILAKGQSNPTYIKRKDDSWSESSAESLDILLNTHFPGCKDVATDIEREVFWFLNVENGNATSEILPLIEDVILLLVKLF